MKFRKKPVVIDAEQFLGAVTEASKQLLNRRISEARGWTFQAVNGMTVAVASDNAETDLMHFGEAPDWLSDDTANCVLLDELVLPTLSRRLEGWYCGYHLGPAVYEPHEDRRTAVACAWCRWKGVSLEGLEL